MAGRIPQSFINDLLDRVDIVDVIDRRMTLKKSGKNYSGLCPFHDEKTPSFSVSPDKQFFHCFGCQESGTALTFIMNFDRLDFVEAVESLAQQLGVEVPREQGRSYRAKIDPDIYAVLAQAEKFYRQSLRDSKEAIEYLKGRGLSGEVARDFGIGYAPEGWQNLEQAMPDVSPKTLLEAGLLTTSESGRSYDRFRHRIIFPIRDTRGRVIGFGGRILGSDDGPKYLNSPETPVFHKGAELYGLYEARKALRQLDRLLVVEGYMDVVALAQYGVANAVATLGTASGEAHFQKLFRHSDEVICCFDGDNAGRQAAWKALENALPTLNEYRQLKFAFLPDGQDPDSIIRLKGKSGLQSFIDNAVPGLEFLLTRLSQGLDLNSIDGRARFAGLVQPYVEKVPEGVLKALLQQKVAQMTGLQRSNVPAERANKNTKRASGRVKGVSERLLSILLQRPSLWQTVDEEVRNRLRQALDGSSVVGEIVAYIDDNASADVEELLVYFADHADAAALREQVGIPLEIDDDASRLELADVCRKLLSKLQVDKRKVALQDLQESPNVDELRKYWQLRGVAKD